MLFDEAATGGQRWKPATSPKPVTKKIIVGWVAQHCLPCQSALMFDFSYYFLSVVAARPPKRSERGSFASSSPAAQTVSRQRRPLPGTSSATARPHRGESFWRNTMPPNKTKQKKKSKQNGSGLTQKPDPPPGPFPLVFCEFFCLLFLHFSTPTHPNVEMVRRLLWAFQRTNQNEPIQRETSFRSFRSFFISSPSFFFVFDLSLSFFAPPFPSSCLSSMGEFFLFFLFIFSFFLFYFFFLFSIFSFFLLLFFLHHFLRGLDL